MLQRVLAAHPEISTAAEPWLLLPFLHTLRAKSVRGWYGHWETASAIRDFAETLPSGAATYREELRRFALALYGHAAGPSATYFLDKTPAYYLAIDQILALFPEAKCIFLWRHPLSVVASNISTFGYGAWQPKPRWDPDAFRVDFFNGVANLVDAYRRHAKRAHAARYEQLVSGEETHWRAMMDYLGLPFDPAALSRFSEVELKGQFQDSTGSQRYRHLSQRSLHRWTSAFGNPIRQTWARYYLNWIGQERLETMGYDLDSLLHDLRTVPNSWEHVGSDAVGTFRSWRARRRRIEALEQTAGVSAWRYLLGMPER